MAVTMINIQTIIKRRKTEQPHLSATVQAQRLSVRPHCECQTNQMPSGS